MKMAEQALKVGGDVWWVTTGRTVQQGVITRDLHDEYRIVQGQGAAAYVAKRWCFGSEIEAIDEARVDLLKQREKIDAALTRLGEHGTPTATGTTRRSRSQR